MKHFGECAACC